MSNNPSPSDFVRCFDRSFGHPDATGNPIHNHSCTNSAVIVLSSSNLVDSILCQSVLRHGIAIEYEMFVVRFCRTSMLFSLIERFFHIQDFQLYTISLELIVCMLTNPQ